ncbi:MAG: chemotaxis-specific protein-glutamate methyltransferase CheB [Sedimentisphaerales bacterium]|nr:chemotaxis-specific protein-glutamate methyltransferase CheB [Sedimentisphaerales bacterium]
MIKVLIVEDSRVMQELLAHIINSDPMLRVVSIVGNGEEAIDAVNKFCPDIITMDISMPKMDGITATRRIMETHAIPIVIVSGNNQATEVAYSFQLLEAGAIAVLLRPPGIGHPDYKRAAGELIQTLKLMSEIKVVTRTQRVTKERIISPPSSVPYIPKSSSTAEIIAIGASTGGPHILKKIISGLPKNLPVPLLIVQHIARGFVEGFVEWLSSTCNFPLHTAAHGEYLLPCHGYVAPDNFHMGVGSDGQIVLSNHAPENGLKPSVAYLFRTTAQVFGSRAVGVLLTGMGRDGADELKLMKEKGAVTFAQDKESSVVHGMPGEAIKLNAATHILSPENITAALTALTKR